jgi:hypothetical protein
LVDGPACAPDGGPEERQLATADIDACSGGVSKAGQRSGMRTLESPDA